MTYTHLWTAKYLVEGAVSIDQIIAMLEGEIQHLREQQTAGVTLDGPVDGGHAVLVTDDPQRPERSDSKPMTMTTMPQFPRGQFRNANLLPSAQSSARARRAVPRHAGDIARSPRHAPDTICTKHP